ncbi:flavin reductase family protein [Pseudarthrobacter cellobiosi]
MVSPTVGRGEVCPIHGGPDHQALLRATVETWRSRTWPLLRQAGRFTVNILPAGHQHLAAQFARSGAEKFAGVEYSASPLGNPVLDQALAWVDCELHEEYDGGDHTIVVGAVRALGARDGAEPLLFFKGAYFEGVPFRSGARESVA